MQILEQCIVALVLFIWLATRTAGQLTGPYPYVANGSGFPYYIAHGSDARGGAAGLDYPRPRDGPRPTNVCSALERVYETGKGDTFAVWQDVILIDIALHLCKDIPALGAIVRVGSKPSSHCVLVCKDNVLSAAARNLWLWWDAGFWAFGET